MSHHVGEDIRSLRKSRGMTLLELAGDVGRSVGWLSQVERGQTTPSVHDLGQISDRLGVNISFFFRSASRAPEERGLVLRAADRTPIGSQESGLVDRHGARRGDGAGPADGRFDRRRRRAGHGLHQDHAVLVHGLAGHLDARQAGERGHRPGLHARPGEAVDLRRDAPSDHLHGEPAGGVEHDPAHLGHEPREVSTDADVGPPGRRAAHRAATPAPVAVAPRDPDDGPRSSANARERPRRSSNVPRSTMRPRSITST